MNKILKFAVAVVLVSFSVFTKAETAGDAPPMPPFAVARLFINKMGVFLDQNGAFANHIIPNAGPLAKVFLANMLFKLPIDESLNFEGPAQIFYMAPLTFNATQDTAMILPVSDAEKLKKNLASVYGEGTEQNGALQFMVQQTLPDPDKPLLFKIANGKALLAPSAAVMKQLEILAAGELGVQRADAALAFSIPGIKKWYGDKIEGALQAGAYLAAESVDGLKTVTQQLAQIQKGLWSVDRLELRVSFDKDSKNANVELAIVPLKDTELAAAFANPPPGLEHRNSTLLAGGAPINAAMRLNGDAVMAFYKKQFPSNPAASESLIRALLSLLDGESALSFDPARLVLLQSQHIADEQQPKKTEAIEQTLRDILAAAAGDIEDPKKKPVFAAIVEPVQYKNTAITLRKIGTQIGPDTANVGLDSSNYFAHAKVNNLWTLGAGVKPDDAIKNLVDAKTPIPVELKRAFDAPRPGTLAFVSIKLLEIARLAVSEILPATAQPAQITDGLADAPVALSVVMHDGEAALSVTLPGATAGSLYHVNDRLKRAGVNLGQLMGVSGKKADTKIPGNVPGPLPEK